MNLDIGWYLTRSSKNNSWIKYKNKIVEDVPQCTPPQPDSITKRKNLSIKHIISKDIKIFLLICHSGNMLTRST